MRKMIGILVGILFFCLFFGQALADSTTTVTTDTDIGIAQDFSNHSQVNTYEKRPFPYATGPSAFVGTPFSQPQKGKYFIYWTPLDKSFTLENIEMMRKKVRVEEIVLFKWLKRHVRVALREKRIERPAKAIERQEYPWPESESLKLLNWDPEKFCHENDKDIGEVVLTGGYAWDPWPFSAVLGVAQKEAIAVTNTRRIVTYVRIKEEAIAKGLALNTNGAAAKVMGPSGQAADNIAGVLVGGAMIGWTSLSMKDIEEIRIRCLNDGPIDAPKLPEVAKPEVPKPEQKVKSELDELNKSLADLKGAIKDLAEKVKQPEVRPEDMEQVKKKLAEIQKELAAKKAPPKIVKPRVVAPPPAPKKEVPTTFEFKGEFKGEGSVKK